MYEDALMAYNWKIWQLRWLKWWEMGCCFHVANLDESIYETAGDVGLPAVSGTSRLRDGDTFWKHVPV